MDFKVILTDQAISDLKEIVEFVSKDDPQAAKKLGDALIEKALSLTRFPERDRVVPELGEEKTREVSLRPYRIIYDVEKAWREVYVIRFWHAARGEPET